MEVIAFAWWCWGFPCRSCLNLCETSTWYIAVPVLITKPRAIGKREYDFYLFLFFISQKDSLCIGGFSLPLPKLLPLSPLFILEKIALLIVTFNLNVFNLKPTIFFHGYVCRTGITNFVIGRENLVMSSKSFWL